MNTTQFNLITALLLCAAFAAPNLAFAVAISGQGTWETTLQGRDLDGNSATVEAYYDTSLNITWLADADLALTSGHSTNGLMYWADAQSWASSLNFSGITDWRLPRANPVDGDSTDNTNTSNIGTEDRGANISAPGTLYAESTASEMAHLYYNTLGNLSYYDVITGASGQSGWGLSNTGPFANLNGWIYWTETSYILINGTIVKNFNFYNGVQDGNGLGSINHAMIVHDGDVGAAVSTSAVPVPAAAWLLGGGLLGIVGIAKRKRVA